MKIYIRPEELKKGTLTVPFLFLKSTATDEHPMAPIYRSCIEIADINRDEGHAVPEHMVHAFHI